MRDYPSVPSVFRVASTHSINSESPYNNVQPIMHPTKISSSISHNIEQQPHQLTTSASIEHSYPSQQQQEHSPYATLPPGPQWLFTEEKLPNVNYNGTANFNALDDGAYITKYTKSSLWILCTTLPGLDVDSYNCIKIDYFPNEGYQPDPHDSTPAIPYTVTKSCPIFLAAGVFLVISFIVFLIPTCSHQNNLFYFSAGILFIVSGLVMLIGLIAYISILKAEIGSKLRPRSTLQPALFKVTYGQSFFLFVFGFIVTEFVGVLNIFLFINLQEISYYGRLPCFSVANINAKIKEGQQQQQQQQQQQLQHPLSHSYKRYKQPGVQQQQTGSQDALNQVHLPANHQQSQSHETYQPQMQRTLRGNTAVGRQHQVHDAGRNPGQTQTLPGGYACRKHPNVASNLNLYLHNDLERRFYFEKPAVSKCNLHSRSFAKSLNELSGPTGGPVAPLTLPAPALFADLPQEFPLTRSVSTTTDIYSTPPTGAAAAAAVAPNTGQLKRKQHRNMATNTHNVQPQDQSRLCGLKRGLRKTKDELFQEFCRRTGVLGRAKPKNIYYISGGEEEDEQQQRGIDPETTLRQDDDDADGDDHGFRQFRCSGMDEDRLYVVGDHAQLVGPRRASMCPLEAPMGHPLRKLNSNLSLHNETAWPGAAFASGQLRLMPPEQAQSRTLPPAIPSSPSNYGHGGYQQHPQPLYPATSVAVNAAPGAAHPPKFQRGYAFDDAQRRASFAVNDAAFDLDEIERERRRSHASLFGQNLDPYDLINGTAV
ncbi:blast:Voltage-dependent calcium channel gamma-5 subunit [Drosophila guanche]|uniref:Blast:Voltage-dependent calcium channel gamma-5 subunit n=1 Tax=Drosophila guanche TaxID=7266 RepID=A0A3B0JRH6_DROGU|nr:blast:Voltage-dependent calcium channel gamma-5 subunit [Drosophila guanche]